ncbi:hypothetical protein BD410DRAFT_903159 [Rickenella mellea]|uniref:F-box domain-containing protein n=1 Tax=Rickenella mellea TaxID=50990 RepID=A0A4Y7PGN1_9AGAM|nr:hypothetical protein BD410DRAFT_903159 [Rickenella mellea]
MEGVNTVKTASPTSADDVDRLTRLFACVKEMGWKRAFDDDVLYGQVNCDDSHLYAEPLHSLREALQDAKLCMEGLNKVRNQLGKKIRMLKRRSTPLIAEDGIRRLPDELLAHIFEIEHLSTQNCMSSLRASHVSSRFRQVALHTPLLWTRLSSSYTIDQMQTFLSRSGNLYLDVIHASRPQKGNNFLDVVDSLSSRWVRLTITDIEQVEEMSATGVTTFPNLRCISYDHTWSLAKDSHMRNWNMPLLSHYVGRSLTINSQHLSQITSLDLHFLDDYFNNLDVPLLAKALYQAYNLQHVSLKFIKCNLQYPIPLPENPPPHSISTKTLKVTIKSHKSTVDCYSFQQLSSVLACLLPSEVDISLEETPVECIYNNDGQIFPHASAIRLCVSGRCDLLRTLAGLVGHCNTTRSVHLDAPEGYIYAWEIQRCSWAQFASIRHIRIQNCDLLCEEDVKIMASNLFFDDADVGLQSLEVMSCKKISEDFILNLSDDVGERLKWSF